MLTNLILSGGAIRSCSHIGCIRYLEEQKALTSIFTVIGASAGSMFAFLVCMGYSSIEMTAAFKDLLHMQSECPPDIDRIFNIYTTMGLSDGELFTKFITKHLQKRYGVASMTFLEFAKKSGKNLVVYASKLPTLEKHYFSLENTPNLDICIAIRASCCIPILFAPVCIDDEYYVDAGIVDNFPFDYVKDNKLKDTLGIMITSKPSACVKYNLLSLMSTLMGALICKSNNLNGLPPPCLKIVEIENENVDTLDLNFNIETCSFKISDEQIEVYVNNGYTCVQKGFRPLATV
jgi:NTE family protein